MAVLTVTYVSVVVYANTNSDHSDVVYAAFEYESETLPTDWYTPEQLGTIKIIEYGENETYWLHVVIDCQKEPFPLQEEQPIFIYKDKFYQISPLWATPGLPESVKGQLITGGLLLGSGWILAVGFLINGRKKE